MRKVLILLVAALAPFALAADVVPMRFDGYQPEPHCGDTLPLTTREQVFLGLTHGLRFIGYYRVEGQPREIKFTARTPGAFIGDDFPDHMCGAQVELTLNGGPIQRGTLEIVLPDPKSEYKPYTYQVHLEGGGRLIYSQQYDTVWGRVDASTGSHFFTAADHYRWEQ